MSDLSIPLNLANPLIWVVSDESREVLNTVANFAATTERPVWHMDAIAGLRRHSQGKWRQHLMPNPISGEPEPCYDSSVAIRLASSTGGVLVFEVAQKKAEGLVEYLAANVRNYVSTVVNSEDDPPATFVLVSHSDEVPPELKRIATVVRPGLPDAEALTKLATQTIKAAGHRPGDLSAVVRAGAGLSELEFVHGLLASLHKHRLIDEADMLRFKIATLSRSLGVSIIPKPDQAPGFGGFDRLQNLLDRIQWAWTNPEAAEEMGVVPVRRILTIGVPGVGKSLFAEVAAARLGLDLVKFGVSQAMNKYVGQSEENARALFRAIKAMAPVGLWMDEAGRDLSGSQSSSTVDGGTTDRVHGEFLTGMQELPTNVFLTAAANRIDSLPPEMTRADRFDKIVFMGFPTLSERVDIIKIHLGGFAEQIDTQALAAATPYFTGAELKSLIRNTVFDVATLEHRYPTSEEFVANAPKLKGRVWVSNNAAIADMYRRAIDEWEWASSEQEKDAERVLAAARNLAKK